MRSIACPICEETAAFDFFELAAMPVLIGTLWQEVEKARRSATGDLILTFCPACGYIWNRAFDLSLLEYSESYENSLHFSDVFQRYTRGVVNRLIDTYDIRGKDIIDIGCGKGDFLALLCEAGGNRGVGFDPSYQGDRVHGDVSKRLSFVKDLYSRNHSQTQADLIVSRFVLEHIPNPLEFLSLVSDGILDRGTIVYFEVPDVGLILSQLSVWDHYCPVRSRITTTAYGFHPLDFGLLRPSTL